MLTVLEFAGVCLIHPIAQLLGGIASLLFERIADFPLAVKIA
jgi:hypothetical protein